MSKERNPLVYVAKLSSGVREKDLEHDFAKYGSIKSISLKNGYAFIVINSINSRNMTTTEMPKTPLSTWTENPSKDTNS